MDSEQDKLLAESICVCLITPQGREKESIFGTEMGRQQLCTQAQASRLLVVHLGNGHKFSSMKEVQDDLNAKILDLAPTDCANFNQIPIMSVGEDIGQKSLIDVKGKTGIEGFIIQDVKGGDQIVRQIIFESKYD